MSYPFSPLPSGLSPPSLIPGEGLTRTELPSLPCSRLSFPVSKADGRTGRRPRVPSTSTHGVRGVPTDQPTEETGVRGPGRDGPQDQPQDTVGVVQHVVVQTRQRPRALFEESRLDEVVSTLHESAHKGLVPQGHRLSFSTGSPVRVLSPHPQGSDRLYLDGNVWVRSTVGPRGFYGQGYTRLPLETPFS